MAPGMIHVGTSGWNYRHWRGTFYPGELPQKDWLDYYAAYFDTVEINNSFYHLPELSTIKDWFVTVPAGFIFSVKASRYITHMKKLKDVRRPMYSLMRRIGVLGHKLGPILVQLPPRWKFNQERFEIFLRYLDHDRRFAVEFRDESWWNDDVNGLLEKYGVAYCIFDLAGSQTPPLVTADFVYIRLHGPGGAYQGCYSEKALSSWAERIASWVREGREVYCYFDNDDSGYAVKNALRLREMLS